MGFTDNVKYLYRYLYKYEKTVIPIWISSNKSEILLLREKVLMHIIDGVYMGYIIV